MNITTSKTGNVNRLQLEGRLEAATVQALKNEVQNLVKAGQAAFVFDMNNVSFVDSSGLGMLVLFGVHHGLAKGTLFLAAGTVHEGRLSRLRWVLLMLPALAIMGPPFTSGAAVQYLLKEAWHESAFAAWLPWLTLASFATALLLWRALWLMWRDQQHASARAPLGQWLPWALLSMASLSVPWFWPTMRAALLAGVYPAGGCPWMSGERKGWKRLVYSGPCVRLTLTSVESGTMPPSELRA